MTSLAGNVSAAFTAFMIAFAGSACSDPDVPRVIPGPAAPSRISTERPFVWDTDAELNDWAHQVASRDDTRVLGEGQDAFVRLRLDFTQTVLRGPDLDPVATGVRGVTIRARFTPDRPATLVRTTSLYVHFEVLEPPWGFQQPVLYGSLEAGVWKVVEIPTRYGVLDVRYAYLTTGPAAPGSVDIDWIAFVK